jgi:hypothetical protein
MGMGWNYYTVYSKQQPPSSSIDGSEGAAAAAAAGGDGANSRWVLGSAARMARRQQADPCKWLNTCTSAACWRAMPLLVYAREVGKPQMAQATRRIEQQQQQKQRKQKQQKQRGLAVVCALSLTLQCTQWESAVGSMQHVFGSR